MKGICFIEPMTVATAEGWKTETRRIINPQPSDVQESPFVGFMANYPASGPNHYVDLNPRYEVGEVVYIKEPYFKLGEIIFYKYDDKRTAEIASHLWKNKLFMPASAARLFIEITAVRAEKLQDISEEECLKEGVQKLDWIDGFKHYCPKQVFSKRELREGAPFCRSARASYSTLIDSINGKGTWASNPWVYAYGYKLTTKPTEL